MSGKYRIHHLVKRTCTVYKIDDKELPYCDLTFVIDGSVNYRINGQSFTVGAGDAVFCPMGASRYREKGENRAVYVSINFMCEKNDIPLLPFYLENVYNHDIDFCISKMLEIYFRSGVYTQNKCSCLLEYILCDLPERRNVSGENKHVVLMKRYISYNWNEGINLPDIADACHLSESYCSSLFKQYVGQTISDYITDIRINRASEMLRYSNESVSEIAEKTGFCDIYYFSRTFKKIKGMSPLQFRKMK